MPRSPTRARPTSSAGSRARLRPLLLRPAEGLPAAPRPQGPSRGCQVLLPRRVDGGAGDVDEDVGAGWPRLGHELHPGHLREPVSLAPVARRAAGHDVVPGRWPATRAGHHVVERECAAHATAVLAGPRVAGENGAPRDLAP